MAIKQKRNWSNLLGNILVAYASFLEAVFTLIVNFVNNKYTTNN